MSELEAIAREIAACHRCDLAKTRNLTVPGEGNPDADIMFVGEAPGWYENQQGRPFVGPAGQFLEQLLESVSLKRSEVFIANVIKCRPPQNRDPLPEEMEACACYLDRQIAAIKPKLLVTLGRFSMAKFFPPGKGIRELHGTTCVKNGMLCFAMYHPAAALHQPALRRTIEQDMLKIPNLVAVASSMGQGEEPPQEKPSQLSLF
ncbi:MAG: uracil-DNA glycosylase [Sphingomonadaceae bacterium]